MLQPPQINISVARERRDCNCTACKQIKLEIMKISAFLAPTPTCPRSFIYLVRYISNGEFNRDTSFVCERSRHMHCIWVIFGKCADDINISIATGSRRTFQMPINHIQLPLKLWAGDNRPSRKLQQMSAKIFMVCTARQDYDTSRQTATQTRKTKKKRNICHFLGHVA